MKNKKIILILVYLMVVGCVDKSEKIELYLQQDIETSTEQSLNFKLTISANSEIDITLSVHEGLRDKFRMKTMKDLNLCKNAPYYLNERKSDAVEIKVSKSNPYIINISAQYRFDNINNMHVYDFGELGKICRDNLNNSFILAFTLYEANIHSLSNIFYDKTHGIRSNRLEIVFD